MINLKYYLDYQKKKRVNNKFYLILVEYLNYDIKFKKKKRKEILKLDKYCENYINNKNFCSDNDINNFKKKLHFYTKNVFN